MAMTPEMLLRLASQHEAAGRLAEAIAAYEQALALRPNAPNSWYNLALLRRRGGRFDAALAAYQEALARGVSDPEEVHLNRAVIFADDLARSEAAEAELRTALQFNPNYVPALLNLGNLFEDRGDRAQARTAYERALALEPNNFMALSRLLGVSEISNLGDPLLRRARDRFANPGTAPAARADLGFALGSALDRMEAYDEAFAAYRAANEASRTAAGSHYDRAAHEALIDRIIHAFAAPVPPLPAIEGQAPIFICGMFRSGSTLTERILASHGNVTAGGELDLIPALLGQTPPPYPEGVAAASPDERMRLRQTYLAALRQARGSASLVTDKRPDNFLHIGFIKSIFPEAKIVHTRRNPLDNVLSIFFLHLDPHMSYALDLDDIVHWYGQYRRLMSHWQRLYGDEIHEVDYDALVADPRPEIVALLRFCGLGWDEACLHFHEKGAAVRTASAGQVHQPLYRRSSGRWRNYRRHLGGVDAALA